MMRTPLPICTSARLPEPGYGCRPTGTVSPDNARAAVEGDRRARFGGNVPVVDQDDLSDVKRRLQAAERDAAPARLLASAADRDVTEIRAEIRDFRNATTSSFNALRQDFVDLRTHVDRGFAEIRGKLDATASGQQHIAGLIQRLIDDRDR